MLVFQINKALREGQTVFAKVPGMDGEQEVLAARACYGDQTQVKVLKDGQTRFITVAPSSVRVAETVEAKG
jgi:hypothetical protein